MLFSQRMGIKPVGKLVQREVIDDDLRNKIWNVLKLLIWDKWEPVPDEYAMHHQSHAAQKVEQMLQALWFYYFKKPLDTQPEFKNTTRSTSYYDELRNIVLKGEWHEVFDLVESIVEYMPTDWHENFIEFLNNVLRLENSAYRMVNLRFVEITDENEINAVEEGIDASVNSVKTHLKRALELLTDRKVPDYRNSIKESISAVEAVCQDITGKPGASLGQCIGAIKQKRHVHPAFEQSLTKLYGFSSDSGGIRHAMTEEGEKPTYADAKFMLVSCSALTNYFRTIQAEG